MGNFLGNPFVTFPAVSGAWTPSDVSLTQQFWYKTDTLGYSADDGIGGSGKEWTDKTTNGYDLVNTTGTEQPLYKLAVQNSKAGVLFDGTDDVLRATTSSLAQNLTFVFIFKTGDEVTSRYLIDGDTSRVLLYMDNSGNLKHYAGSDNNTGFSMAINTTYIIFAFTQNIGSYVRLNGVDGSTYSTGSNALNDIVMGSRFGGTEFFKGYMFEMACYSGILSATDISNWESYSSSEWAI